MEEPDPQEDLLRTMSLWLGDIDEVAAPVTGARVESALQDLGLIWTRWDDADDSWFLPYSSDPGSDIDPMLLVELHGAGRDGGARRLSVLAICSVDFALEDRTRLLDLVNDWNVRDGGWPAASVRDLEKPRASRSSWTAARRVRRARAPPRCGLGCARTATWPPWVSTTW